MDTMGSVKHMKKNWKESLIQPSSTVEDARRVIDRSSMRIALVVDERNRLLGIITESDFRKGILQRIPLDSCVTEIMNASPKTALLTEVETKVAQFFEETRLMHLPVIDVDGILVDVEYYDEHLKISKQDNWVVIMAGGLGGRLRPLTEDIPKALLKVGSKPILERIIENCENYGFSKFFLSVHYKAEMIEEYFSNGSAWGIQIEYLKEKKQMGTAGALSLLSEIPSKPFFVINGDLLTDLNFQDLVNFHSEHKVFATMCIREYEFVVPYGVVRTKDGKIEEIDEKPLHSFFVNAGIYLFEPEVLELVPQDSYLDMPDLFKLIIDSGKDTAVFPIREYWMDVGRIDDYRRADGEINNIGK